MANWITVSVIGSQPYPLGVGVQGQHAVNAMMQHWKTKLDQVLPDQPTLIVLPEMCDRPAQCSTEDTLSYYDARGEQIRDFFSRQARMHHCYIAYSALRELPDGSRRNTTQLIGADGEVVGVYNKNHLIREETTEWGVLCGKDAPIIRCGFGKVACAICFDLNFDELRLTYVREKPDLVLFSSVYHGGLMQRYWAYSCRCYLAAAVAGLPSSVISPVGEVVASTTNYHDSVTVDVNLDCAVVHLDYHTEKIRAVKAKYGRKVKVSDPGFLGSVLLSAETEDLTTSEVLQEFAIETLDQYLRRARVFHRTPENIES